LEKPVPIIPLRDLGNNLLLRRATPADADALADINARIHSDGGPDISDDGIAAWTRDLLTRPHPTFRPGDFTIVEDTRTGQIVSSLNLISQTWTYAGIPFGVGRVELVGTLPEYRRRGLVRAQMDVVHQWSAERGELVQGITGIPWYYRQFGYEMGLVLGGARIGFQPHVPELKDGEPEPFVIRPATSADVPFIMGLYEQSVRSHLIACVRDEAVWRYELSGKSEKNVNRRELRVIETADGEPVGFLAHPHFLWGASLSITAYELKPGVSWLAATPGVIRYAWATGQAYAVRDQKKHESFRFDLGLEHPAYEAAADQLPHNWEPYAWYVRVPDIVGFLRHITPALEKRLADSVAAGHTGEFTISWYRGGVRLRLDRGRLSVEPWQPQPNVNGDVSFPELTFLHVLFGHRTFDELRYAYPDCWTKGGQAPALLKAIFPKQPSRVWPID
jgi:hypothetical protein